MSYQPVFPATLAADDPLRSFVASFYETSDDAGRTDDWVAYFLPDAEVQIGNDGAAGIEEIRNFRLRMWDKVAERKHTPRQLFESAFDDARPGERQFMLFGDVGYVLKTGEKLTAPWAAYAKIRGGSDRLRFASYHVYIQR